MKVLGNFLLIYLQLLENVYILEIKLKKSKYFNYSNIFICLNITIIFLCFPFSFFFFFFIIHLVSHKYSDK